MHRVVPRCQLAPGLDISRVVTGLWQLADMERDGQPLDLAATASAMTPYVEAGLTTFDMADHYGSAEDVAGLFREQQAVSGGVQLLTKWVPKPGPVTREDVRSAVCRSLDRLRSEQVELLQFHAWTFAHPSWLDCLFWLQELKGEGLVRQIGLTNFDTAHLRIAVQSGIEIASNQVCFSLLDQRARGRLSAFCLQHGVQLLAYGTVAGGFLSERWLGADAPDWSTLATWSQMKYGRFIQTAGGWAALQRVLAAAQGVARRHGVSIANVACRYILEQPAVGAIIIGARLGQRSHVEDTLQLFSFEIDAADRSDIDRALVTLDPIPGDTGDEYRRPPYLTASGDLSHHVDDFPAPYAVRTAAGGRRLALSGTEWESLAGFSRAVREGERIWVSGTTATHGRRSIGGADPAAQMHFAIDKLEGALHTLGARLEHVVRTRVFVRHMADWEACARAHGERFADILPANTLVQAELVGEEYLVEIEAEAAVGRSAEIGGL